jgi:hypothetical protein
MITMQEYRMILEHYGPGQAERCAAGDCTHTHQAPMVDLRCPESMGKLLGRTQPVLHTEGMVELACGNCARAFRKGGMTVARVVHRYNLLGELLATQIYPAA